MHIYPICLTFIDDCDTKSAHKEGPMIGDVLAVRLTRQGMNRKFRKLDWRKEIMDHLIFIDERDMYKATCVEIEEVMNTLYDDGAIPEIHARVSYAVENKLTGKVELKRKVYLVIAPLLDAKI